MTEGATRDICNVILIKRSKKYFSTADKHNTQVNYYKTIESHNVPQIQRTECLYKHAVL